MNDPKPNSALAQLPHRAGVAVVRLRSLGDSVLATPAIHLLKRTRPDLRIAVISEPRFAEIYEDNPDVDAVLKPSVRTLRAFSPELCLNLHGGSASARLTLLSAARFRAGFQHFRFSDVYNIQIPRAQETLGVERTVHTAEHAASAVFHLGARLQEIPRARLFAHGAAPIHVRGPYAVIHPAASHPGKTWPAPFFITVAQYLNRELGLQPVFIAGPGEDIAQFQMWPVIAGAGLNQVKALLKSAALFIGNDSGPAHMAAAFGLPVIALFGPSDEMVWGPWKTESVILKSAGPIHNIGAEQVMRALDRLRVHA